MFSLSLSHVSDETDRVAARLEFMSTSSTRAIEPFLLDFIMKIKLISCEVHAYLCGLLGIRGIGLARVL